MAPEKKGIACGEFRVAQRQMWPVFMRRAGNSFAQFECMRENGTALDASLDPGITPVALLSR